MRLSLSFRPRPRPRILILFCVLLSASLAAESPSEAVSAALTGNTPSLGTFSPVVFADYVEPVVNDALVAREIAALNRQHFARAYDKSHVLMNRSRLVWVTALATTAVAASACAYVETPSSRYDQLAWALPASTALVCAGGVISDAWFTYNANRARLGFDPAAVCYSVEPGLSVAWTEDGAIVPTASVTVRY